MPCAGTPAVHYQKSSLWEDGHLCDPCPVSTVLSETDAEGMTQAAMNSPSLCWRSRRFRRTQQPSAMRASTCSSTADQARNRPHACSSGIAVRSLVESERPAPAGTTSCQAAVGTVPKDLQGPCPAPSHDRGGVLAQFPCCSNPAPPSLTATPGPVSQRQQRMDPKIFFKLAVAFSSR